MTLRIRQDLSVTHLLLESVSRVYGTPEIVTRSTLQHKIKQTNNFTKEKKIYPLCVWRNRTCRKRCRKNVLDILCKFKDPEELEAYTETTINLTGLPPRTSSIKDEILNG